MNTDFELFSFYELRVRKAIKKKHGLNDYGYFMLNIIAGIHARAGVPASRNDLKHYTNLYVQQLCNNIQYLFKGGFIDIRRTGEHTKAKQEHTLTSKGEMVLKDMKKVWKRVIKGDLKDFDQI